MNALRRAFAGAATAWSAGIMLATVVASRPQSQVSSAGYAFALAMYAAGSLICHQRPERSFHLLGAQMPVCARCAGIYAGAAVAAIVLWLRTLRRLASTCRGCTRAAAVRVLLIAALPAAGTLAVRMDDRARAGQLDAPHQRRCRSGRRGSAMGAASM